VISLVPSTWLSRAPAGSEPEKDDDMTKDEITDTMIAKLRDEAAAAGDVEILSLCEDALISEDEGRRDDARAECVRVIVQALGAADRD
jgi:hypothetical protein